MIHLYAFVQSYFFILISAFVQVMLVSSFLLLYVCVHVHEFIPCKKIVLPCNDLLMMIIYNVAFLKIVLHYFN